MRQDEFARLIGISVRSLGAIERGEHDAYDGHTIAAIEDALAWEPGSAQRVLDGAQPRTIDPDLSAIVSAWPHPDASTKAILAKLAHDMARPPG